MAGHQASGDARLRRLESWRKGNVKAAIRRRERTLVRSMAHIPHPRPADLDRWRTMQANIDMLKRRLAEMEQEKPNAPAR